MHKPTALAHPKVPVSAGEGAGASSSASASSSAGAAVVAGAAAPKQIGSRSQIGGHGHSSRQTRQIHPFRSRSVSAAAHHRHQRMRDYNFVLNVPFVLPLY